MTASRDDGAGQRLLGFDYGTRHIGVATGQTLTGTAQPLATVAVRQLRPDWAHLEALIDEWQPDALVVGDPLNMDGTEQPLTKQARRFGNQLNGRFQLPVYRVDERLTTREARSMMHPLDRRPGTRSKRERGPLSSGGRGPWVLGLSARGIDDHAVAAQIILESWMREHQDLSGRPPESDRSLGRPRVPVSAPPDASAETTTKINDLDRHEQRSDPTHRDPKD